MVDTSALPVLKIQRFSTHDGPGVRTTVFIKGCPLRCKWCHNPESQRKTSEIFYTPKLCIHCATCSSICPQNIHIFEGETHIFKREGCIGCLRCLEVCPSGALEGDFKELTLEKIVEQVQKDLIFYGKDGGVTLSGGEPLLHTENVLPLLRKLKTAGIGTCVETSGYFDRERIPALVETVDLFLWDIKDCDEERHKQNTGVSNRKILENLMEVDRLGGKTIVRCIMLNGINTGNDHLDKVAEIYRRLKHCKGVEIFSYHHYGESKYFSIGREYFGKREWIVPEEKLKSICAYLKGKSVKCKITE